jgi:hypothetical protein
VISQNNIQVGWFMVLNTTFNNNSVLPWLSVLTLLLPKRFCHFLTLVNLIPQKSFGIFLHFRSFKWIIVILHTHSRTKIYCFVLLPTNSIFITAALCENFWMQLNCIFQSQISTSESFFIFVLLSELLWSFTHIQERRFIKLDLIIKLKFKTYAMIYLFIYWCLTQKVQREKRKNPHSNTLVVVEFDEIHSKVYIKNALAINQ